MQLKLNLQEGMEGNPMAGKMKMFSRGMAFMTVPFTMNFAQVRILLYADRVIVSWLFYIDLVLFEMNR